MLRGIGNLVVLISILPFSIAAAAGADWHAKYPTDDPDPPRVMFALGLIGPALLVCGMFLRMKGAS
ncbi:hypothetical protein SAMN05444003_2281 [Cognatiyoonia sediminum]|uniref:MYXO-CTERM domain-containing protein n=1 Tax=Cognatiyoonia sediminum TaxID=1508389 RepID=A0A1M5QSY8_9RHOB|nr:hypothetical protein [Cognatiyoonia sediminum]SHH16703.1 hypothetical protein SAMN05444003_2281 [Cognatiyoonia sediminum]